jgi:hypothetical protein
MIKELLDKLDSVNEHTKHVIDWTSLGIAFGSLIQILPSIAAALSILWTVIRIYETKTVQKWLGKGKKNA